MDKLLIQNKRRVHEIVHELTQKILNGPLSAGERLCEQTLAVYFGTSRGPVREALQKLEARGLVCIIPNSGARVAYYALPDYLNIYSARECMEGMAARLAAASMNAVEKSKLRKLISEHEQQFHDQPQSSYFQPRADVDFHHAIICGSRNPLLYKILCQDLYPLLQLCRRLHSNRPGRGMRALVEHIRILEAIDEGDGELAEIMMRRHISASRSCVENIYANQSGIQMNPILLKSRPPILKWEN